MPILNGTRIRQRRDELDLSTAELAGRLGISEGYLRNIISTTDPARERLAYRIARELSLPIEEVLPQGGQSKKPPREPKDPTSPPRRKDKDSAPKAPKRATDEVSAA